MMRQFKVPKLSPTAQKMRNRRNELLSKAPRSKRAVRALEAEYSLRVYSQAEIEAFVSERPELETAEVIGNSSWDSSKPNFSY